jgi:hypothetical protein
MAICGKGKKKKLRAPHGPCIDYPRLAGPLRSGKIAFFAESICNDCRGNEAKAAAVAPYRIH